MRLALTAAAVVTLAARAAAADDLGTSMGRGELWTAPGLVDVRVSVMRIGLYGTDDARRGTVVDLVAWESIGEGDGLEHPRDFGARSAAQVVTLRRQIDRDDWGAYVAGDAFTRWFGHNRVATPRLGLRLGRFDRAAAVVRRRDAVARSSRSVAAGRAVAAHVHRRSRLRDQLAALDLVARRRRLGPTVPVTDV